MPEAEPNDTDITKTLLAIIMAMVIIPEITQRVRCETQSVSVHAENKCAT